MYCVIQKVENKKSNTWGGSKSLEVDILTWSANGKVYTKYHYKYTGGTFERPIKTAYKISIHKSYRENGKVKKKQWVICTIGYYEILEFWPGDCLVQSELERKLKEMDITEDQLWDMVYKKFQPIVDAVTKEFEATEEFKTKKKHDKILKKYTNSKYKFEQKYGKNTYDYCYDVFGVLRNEEYLKELEANYKAQQEYNRRCHEDFKSNYSNYDFGGYSASKGSTYTEDERDKLKKIYRALAAKFHPDISKDDGEMMKFVNKLKEQWGI